MKMEFTLLISILALAMNTNAAEWEHLAPLPEPNGGFFCNAINGEIVVGGGTNWKDGTKHWLSRIHTYNPVTNQWREIGTLDAPLAYAAVGQDADAVWFAGGSSGTATNRVVWKMGADFAIKRAHTLDTGPVLAGGALIGTTLYTLGGTDDMDQLSRVTRTLLAVDLRTGGTVRLADYPEAAFMIGAFAACGDRLFAFGGARWDATTNEVANFSTAHAYSMVAERWEKLPPLPCVNRGITAVALDERHILLAGGYKNDEEEFTADTFIFDVKTSSYSATKPLPYKAMVGLVKSGEWLYCLGGENRKKQRTDAAFRIRWKDLLPR